MDTFHIKPQNKELAFAASLEVCNFYPDTLVAIRGQIVDGDAVLYTVSSCPNQEDTSGYEWQYVKAGEWMQAYINQG